MRHSWLAAVLVCGPFALGTASMQTPTTDSLSSTNASLQSLEREIARLSSAAGGVVGVSATHMESNRQISLNGDERFPMASTFKVAVAVEVLARVDRDEMHLEQMIDIRPSDLHPGAGILTDLLNQPGLAISVRNLLELMLLISDNSATDVCLRLVGGPKAVTARMRAVGIEDIDISRSTAQVLGDWVGLTQSAPDSQLSATQFNSLATAVKPELRQIAAERFDRDQRDTATPEAMSALLARVYRGDLLTRRSSDLLLDIMRRCRTGEERLRGMLPAGTEVAHKTGSLGSITNDVGIVTLPYNAGHVAIVVFVKSSTKEVSSRERAIAEISRTVYDFFLFNRR